MNTFLRSRHHAACAALVLFFALANQVFAARILWVSDAPGGPTVPDPAFMGAGLDQNLTDGGFVKLLIDAGHTVERYDNPSTSAELIPDADITRINSYDLVIVGRATLSGQFNRGTADAPQQGYQWTTAITKPLILMSPYLARPAMMGWFTGGTLPDNGEPARATAVDPASAAADYVLGGVAMIGNEMVDAFDVLSDRNTSFIQNEPVPGGRQILTSTFSVYGNPASVVTGELMTDFPAGTMVGDVNDPTVQAALAGYRMWLAGGSRESATGPQNEVSLFAGRENLTAAGESIFLRAVELALRSGTPPATNETLAVTRQPANLTVRQGQPARFDAAVSGPAPRTLKWQRSTDGTTFTDIPDATTPFRTTAYIIPAAAAADNGAQFRLVATSGANTVTSTAATLTVQADTAAPAIASAGSVNGSTVDIYFDELVDTNDAALLNTANYKVNGSSAGVTTVTPRPDRRSVVLTLAQPLTGNTFSLNVANVGDTLGNKIPAAGVTASGTVLGLTSTSVGALNPLEASGAFFRGPNSLEVIGGGLDLIHNATDLEDELQFVHKTVTGDFDARVRVDSMASARLEATAKAILSVRESTEPNAMSFNVFANPPAPGNDEIQATVRNFAGDVTNLVGQLHRPNGLPQQGPWLRITRTGETLTAYRSTDGVQWTEVGKTDPTALSDLPDALEVGLGATSHLNGEIMTATFSNFQILTGTVSTPIQIVNIARTGGTFSAAFATDNGASYTVQYKDALNAATWTTLTTVTGDGTVKSFSDAPPVSATGHRFFRVSRP